MLLFQQEYPKVEILFLFNQVALANDIGKHVEEILLYTSFTIKIDPSGALLCVQQVIKYLILLFIKHVSDLHFFIYSY